MLIGSVLTTELIEGRDDELHTLTCIYSMHMAFIFVVVHLYTECFDLTSDCMFSLLSSNSQGFTTDKDPQKIFFVCLFVG